MDRDIFKSGRYFKISDFLTSHGQLLLRSNKTDEQKVNVDIIFFDTTYIQLTSSLYGIAVRVVDKKRAMDYNSLTSFLKYEHNHLFEIETENGEKYYIAASFVRVFENGLDFNETSLGVLQYKGREKEIASSLGDVSE
ncbi:MAG TPA: hypothetical protein VGM30_12660 [Puia sp.]|jgi:hypothetical protein